ncbi:MAG TPA: glycosyltransferase, partial [Polyangiaceae bacterium]|nr:glycosyltransferase [Polyangiaceae bacterium]
MASSTFQTESFVSSRSRVSRDWPRRIAILNDYVRIPYANGSSFASQLLYREFRKRGHDVVVIGPHDPDARAAELPREHVSLPSLPLRNHPGVRLALPSRAALDELMRDPPDVVLGQTCSGLLELGAWMRQRLGVPFLCVNTVHLPSVYNVMLPDSLLNNETVRGIFSERLIPFAERQSARLYDQSDGLIVLSSGLASYWRERGVGAPIFVIPRCIEPRLFDVTARRDPFPAGTQRGRRLLVVCRHSREKNVERLLEVFARWIAPAVAGSTLTLVGDGPDHDAFRARAALLGVADRTHFVGEQSASDVAAWYQHADVFVYASLSETYGQVVSEAMWSGLPTVAFEDGMGVSQQIESGLNGVLVPPGPDETAADWRFAVEVAGLLRDPARRRALGAAAQRLTRERSDIDASIERYYAAFEAAREHAARRVAHALTHRRQRHASRAQRRRGLP